MSNNNSTNTTGFVVGHVVVLELRTKLKLYLSSTDRYRAVKWTKLQSASKTGLSGDLDTASDKTRVRPIGRGLQLIYA